MENLPAKVDIPPSMTTEHYREMKILPGHRIGFDYKQTYLSKLSDLYTEGYLTEQEYEKRVEWVNDAQTSEQIDCAFLDLQPSLLQLKINSYLQTQPETQRPATTTIVLILFLLITAMVGNFIAAGSVIITTLLAAEIFFSIIALIKRKL